jgi:hypothetical protein
MVELHSQQILQLHLNVIVTLAPILAANQTMLLQLQLALRIIKSKDSSKLHAEITGLSLGCGDPVTIASLKTGQIVLDLGSGGGMDCFLAASRVGLTGQSDWRRYDIRNDHESTVK